MESFCTKCGTPGTGAFCADCGHPRDAALAAQGAQAPAVITVSAPQQRHSLPALLSFFIPGLG